MSEHPRSEHPLVSMRLIVRCVAEEYDLPERHLYSLRRDTATVTARHAVYWLARHFHQGSLYVIARELGGRDHTTVLHGEAASKERYAQDKEFAARVDRLAATISYLANQKVAAQFADPDAVEVAERVMSAAEPLGRGAHSVSALELVAVCGRLLALEEAAAGTYQLIAHMDALSDARGSEREARLAQSTRALIGSLASTLAALGYAPETEPSTPTPTAGETNHDAASANA